MKRKKYVISMLMEIGVKDLSVIEKCPIGCADGDFFTPLSSNDISAEGRVFFDEFKIERELLMEWTSDLKEAVKHNNEEIDPIEDDITSYTFCRAYATRLHIMGFRRDEISYILGHDINDSPFCRNDFRYKALRMQIKNRMELMPLSGSYKLESVVEIKPNSRVDFDRAGNYVVPANASMIHVHLDSTEPNDNFELKLEHSSKAIITNVHAITSYHPAPAVYSEEYDVINKYHERIAEAESRLAEMKKSRGEMNKSTEDYNAENQEGNI